MASVSVCRKALGAVFHVKNRLSKVTTLDLQVRDLAPVFIIEFEDRSSEPNAAALHVVSFNKFKAG